MPEPSDHAVAQLREIRRFMAENFAGIKQSFIEVNARLYQLSNEVRQAKAEVASLRAAVGQDVAMIEDHEDRLKASEK